MKNTAISIAALVVFAATPGGRAVSAPPAVNLVLAGTPSSALQQACGANVPAVQFTITVRNAGSVNSPAFMDPHALQVTDSELPAWSAGAPLPAIPAGASAAVTVRLQAFSKPEAMPGTHRFQITINRSASGSVAVTFPEHYCAPRMLTVRPGTMHTGLTRPGLLPPLATPTPRTTINNNGVHVSAGNMYTEPAFVAAPVNVQTTTSGDVCSSHVVSFACMVAMKAGFYIVVWDWSNPQCPADNTCPATVDGYRVYGDGKLLGSSTPDQTGLAFDPKQVGAPCFTVSAYKGSTEGSRSAKVCVSKGSAAGVQTQKLAPLRVQSAQMSQHIFSGASSSSSNQVENMPGTLRAGFEYRTNKGSGGDISNNAAWRGAVLFDLAALSGRSIQSATLLVHVISSEIGSDYESNTYTNCVAKIGTGQGDWWDNTGWFDGDWFATAARSDGPDLKIDVTRYVQSWLAGAPNYGFVFQGSEENMNAFTENSCQSTYSSPSLEIKIIGS